MEKRFTCEELAERYAVSLATIWRWVRNGKLKAVNLGKTYVFRPEDIEAFEAANLTTINEEED